MTARKESPSRRPMPVACRSCGRTLRPRATEPIPGTVAFAADGQCGSCYNAAKLGTTVVTPRSTPTECVSCRRPMRTKTKVAPGFVAHAARGMCKPCYEADYKRERALLAYALGSAS